MGVGAAALTAAMMSPRRLGAWRWLLGAWGATYVATALTRYCPANALFGIDNTSGDELVHFDDSRRNIRGRIGHRLNELQHRLHATVHNGHGRGRMRVPADVT
jgi:hypothetical protein